MGNAGGGDREIICKCIVLDVRERGEGRKEGIKSNYEKEGGKGAPLLDPAFNIYED